MNLKYLKINNYRNLDQIEIYLNDTINFLVGENDCGKSNFLDLLEILFCKRKFYLDDFYDEKLPIRIEFSIKLNEYELGCFDDYFSPEGNNNLLNVLAIQHTPDDDIEFTHKETEEKLQPKLFKSINLLKYDPLRKPDDELSLHRNKGVGHFLKYLVDKYTTENATTEDIKHIEGLELIKELINYTDGQLSKIKMFNNLTIKTGLETKINDLIYKMVRFKDSKDSDITNSGHGIQFSLLVVLFLLEKLARMSRYKEIEENEEVSVILALDEPEIHLHPHMQRSLIRYVYNIINNEDEDFAELVKDLFGINIFKGQLIVITHSPNILLDDYRQIIRFYCENSIIKVKSAPQITHDPNLERHFLRISPYIKESFFSKSAIIVEGDTEKGALPLFAEKSNVNLDNSGISIIKADGGDSIPKLMDLLAIFDIKSTAIIDRDIYKESYSGLPNLFLTKNIHFEHEVVSKVVLEGRTDILLEIINDLSFYPNWEVKRDSINKTIEKCSLDIEHTESNFSLSDVDFHEYVEFDSAIYIAWLTSKPMKNTITGRCIGEKLHADLIPDIYKQVIFKAKELAQ